jgi:hypothetical protein
MTKDKVAIKPINALILIDLSGYFEELTRII